MDVVFNHMVGAKDNVVGTGGSVAFPRNKDYPAVAYSSNDFHNDCSVDNYRDPYNVRNCELLGLQDLKQVCININI